MIRREGELMNEEITRGSVGRPWLSVVVPIYNAERWLRVCLDSVLCQSFRDFELILVDDGSSDRSPEICADYAARDPRVRLFRKENTGCYHNRLFGLHQAAGAYVTTIDADDFYLSDRVFRTLYDALLETPCDMIQFGMKQVYRHLSRKGLVNREDCLETGDSFLKKEYPRLFGLASKDQRLFCYVHGKLFARRLLENLPAPEPPERIFFGEDLVLNLYLLRTCASARFLPLRLYAYRETDGGTKRFAKTVMQDLDRVAAHKLRMLAGLPNGEVPAIRYRIFADLAGTLLAYTQNAVRAADRKEAAALVREALALPAFQLGRRFFAEHPEHQWTGACLLRAGDPEACCGEALRRNRKAFLRRSVKTGLKKLYASI